MESVMMKFPPQSLLSRLKKVKRSLVLIAWEKRITERNKSAEGLEAHLREQRKRAEKVLDVPLLD